MMGSYDESQYGFEAFCKDTYKFLSNHYVGYSMEEHKDGTFHFSFTLWADEADDDFGDGWEDIYIYQPRKQSFVCVRSLAFRIVPDDDGNPQRIDR